MSEKKSPVNQAFYITIWDSVISKKMLNPSSQDSHNRTMATQHNFNTESDREDQPPKCDLRCKCCAVQMAFGLVCACNLTKESVGTQTDILVLNMTTEDYFKPKTTAFKLLQNQITSVLHTTKLSSTSDKAFEDSVSEVINFINDLPDTPRTREKVRTRFRKRMYNQKGYEKTKELAIATGGSARKLQWKKAREAVIPTKQPRASVNQRNISIMSSSTSSPVSSPGASPVSTPAHSPETSPTQSPMISPASSVTSPAPVFTEQLPQTNSIGIHFKVGDNVCIASGGKSCDFATVEKIWSSRVDITYLKKAGPKLTTWKLGSGKLYKDSIHKNSVFHCLGKIDQVEGQLMQTIKKKLNSLF
ncbi:uncharacterized protein LOC127737435 isoform X2 [Mytilus californianus]|uniref:uncharacterized protein LOC127737435 isoform X2 n=1 Tax=Mytilus californianus TaxID=6549 RepID=UPI0022473E30|nr:uncharacterized protein LOC127737435 isoform X2 [Mytilus californianus]